MSELDPISGSASWVGDVGVSATKSGIIFGKNRSAIIDWTDELVGCFWDSRTEGEWCSINSYLNKLKKLLTPQKQKAQAAVLVTRRLGHSAWQMLEAFCRLKTINK